jgi:exoribonuclease-2
MDEQLRMQDRLAQALSRVRHELGALEFETIEVQNVFDGDTLSEVRAQKPNRAKSLIENLMIAANGVTARFLDAHAWLRRGEIARAVIRFERWPRSWATRRRRRPLALSDFSRAAAGRSRDVPGSFPSRSPVRPRRICRRSTWRGAARTLRLAVMTIRIDGAEPAIYPGASGAAVRAPVAGIDESWEGDVLHAAGRRRQQSSDRSEVGYAMVVESRVGEQFDAHVTGAWTRAKSMRVTTPIEGKPCAEGTVWMSVIVCASWRPTSTSTAVIDFERVLQPWGGAEGEVVHAPINLILSKLTG